MSDQATPQPQQQPQPKRANIEILELALQQTEEQGKAAARELINVEVERARFDQDYRTARVFYQSGIFSDTKGKSEEQGVATALAKILIGRAWSMNAGDAMQFVYFNRNGSPEVRNEYIAARMKRAGWDWKIDYLADGPRCTGCVIWPSFEGKPLLDKDNKPVSVGFTEADAQTAGLLNKETPWKTYAKDMYFWKCIARLKRQYASDVLTGASFEGELEDALASEPVPQQGNREAQERVKEEKLRQAREWTAQREAKNGAPTAEAQPEPKAPAGNGEFFA